MAKKRPPTALAKRRTALSQYRCLLREIKADKLRLAQMSERLLKLGPVEIPRSTLASADLAGYRARVQLNLERCLLLVEELQDYINSIEDSELRHIFTLRYINDYSWQRIASLLHLGDESVVRKRHDRYIERHP